VKCRRCQKETEDLAQVPVGPKARLTFRQVVIPLCRACRGRYYSKTGIFIVASRTSTGARRTDPKVEDLEHAMSKYHA
jgi:hypothetical protein